MTPDEIRERARFFAQAKQTALDALGGLGPRGAATLFISELERHPDLAADEQYFALLWLELTQLVLPGGSAAFRGWLEQYRWPKPLTEG